MALDPGQTTGYACGRIYKREMQELVIGEGVYSPLEMFGMLESIGPTHVVAESFEYRNRARSGLILTSRNLLGVCEQWSELRHADYCEQSASQGKAYFTDDKLREEGVYSRGRPHARDATRHLLYYLNFGAGAAFFGNR